MDNIFLIYGSYGYTGALIAQLAYERGLRPILAGRDGGKLRKQADEYGLPHLALAIDDSQALDAALKNLSVVLHCAGPFSHTAQPMAEACLRNGVHYLDITGEIDVFESLARRDAQAKAAGVMLLPGSGFDVVPSDCLALHLKNRLPTANRLCLAILGLSRASQGTMRSSIERLDQPAVARVKGKIQPIPGARVRTFDFGRGPKEALAIGWGDVATAFYSTGIPNIETYMVLPGIARRWARWSKRLGRLAGTRPVQRLLKGVVRLLPAGPNAEQRQNGLAILVGEVSAPDGRRALARLQTPEAYRLTAHTALLAVEKVLAGGAKPGFQTPAKAFGADFILEIPGCERTDT